MNVGALFPYPGWVDLTLETRTATAHSEADKINDKAYLVGSTAILLVAFGLRMLGVTAHSLWFDEAVEYFTASVPLYMLPEAVTTVNYQPPLFGFLLHLWLKVSIEPIWLRFLPLVFSMLTVVGLISWSSRIFNRRGAILTGLIITAMPTEIYYAQDVGEYALLVFAVTWSLYFLDLARRTSAWRFWFLWALVSLVGAYTHYGTAIVIVPTAVLVLIENIRTGKQIAVKRELLTVSLSALAVTPLFLFFLPYQINRVDQSLNNVAPLTTLVGELVTFISSLDDSFLYYLVGWPISTIPTWPGIVILIGTLILVIVLRPRMPRILYAWFAVAYVGYFILVRTGLYADSFGFRYGLIFTPLFVMIVVAVIEELFHRRWVFIGLPSLIIILALELYALPTPVSFKIFPGQTTWVPQEPMAELFDYWQEQRHFSEPTFVYYGVVPAFRYYLRLNNLDSERISLEEHPFTTCTVRQTQEICSANNLFYSSWVRQLSTDGKIHNMEEVLGNLPDRLWMIFSHVHQTEKEDMLYLLEDEYKIERMHDLRAGKATVYLLVR